MKARNLWIAVILTALLASPFCRAEEAGETVIPFGTFSGAREINASFVKDGNFSAPWYYEESTLPEGIGGGGVWESLTLLSLRSGGTERITAASLEFLSGDDQMRNALGFLRAGDGQVFLTDRDAAPATGEAVFRIRAESRHLYCETDFVLRKLSWEEYPLFDFRNPDRSADVCLSPADPAPDGAAESREAVQNPYSVPQLAALLEKDHAPDIAESILPEQDRQTFSGMSDGRFLLSGAGLPEDRIRSVTVPGTDGGQDGFLFLETGSYGFVLEDSVFGLSCDVTLRALSYRISGPAVLTPGSTGVWRILDTQAETGRTFTWSAEGADAVFSAGSASVTVPEDAPAGAAFLLTAAPDSGEPAVSVTCSVTGSLLAGRTFRGFPMAEGFTVPVPGDGEDFTFSAPDPQNVRSEWKNPGMPYSLYLDCRVYNPRDEFMEDAEAAARIYAQNRFNLGVGRPENVLEETVTVDGHPAALVTASIPSCSGDYSLGALFYARNNRILRLRLASLPEGGASGEDLPAVTLADLRKLAGMISYDPSLASITAADGAISLTAKGGATALSAGKKLQFSAAFASPDRVNRKAGNNAVEWTVSDAGSGEPAADITVDRKGTISAGRKLTEVKQVVVTASSPVFHTRASCPLTVLPAAAKITVSPQSLIFYAGETREETAVITLTPDTVPPVGIIWEAKPGGLVEILAAEDGTAVLRPEKGGKAGRATVTAKEPGGKSARLNVTVLIPVEALELTVKGKARPGGTVTCAASLQPRSAGNKNLEWSLDVGEETASVNARGQVRISRDAPEGTVLTVTCKALGAPEPVTASVRITVGE